MQATDDGMDGSCSRAVGEKFLESGHTGGANLCFLWMMMMPRASAGRLVCSVRKTKASRMTPCFWPQHLASQSRHFL